MWARFDLQWLKFEVDVYDNFVNALDAIHKRAQMQRCLNGECVELRRCVGLAVLERDWPAFREWAVLRQYRTGHVASKFEKGVRRMSA